MHVVVVAREDSPGDKRLVAYVVPASDVGVPRQELREFLRLRLPHYMVPVDYVALTALPLLPSGKVDRDALPAPDMVEPGEAGASVAPRTPVEERLTDLWQELLRVNRIGVTDNLFDLGADSLLVMRAVVAVRQDFGVDSPGAVFRRDADRRGAGVRHHGVAGRGQFVARGTRPFSDRARTSVVTRAAASVAPRGRVPSPRQR